MPEFANTRKLLDATVFPSHDQTIFVADDPIYGGAHEYHFINSLGFDAELNAAIYAGTEQTIRFVYKPDDGPMEPGAQSEQLALILLDRARKLNARFPSKHNEKQIAGLELFLEGCKDRVEERMSRGVMGQLKK